jgi:hypothetical protein
LHVRKNISEADPPGRRHAGVHSDPAFLVLTLLAIVQFSVALLMRQAVTHAATVGVREAGKGEAIEEVALAMDNVLETSHGIDVVDEVGGVVTPIVDSGVRVFLQVGQPDVLSRPAETDLGDTTLVCGPLPPAPAADEVRVTICIDLTTRPLCNWLFSFDDTAVDFNGRYFQVSSLVKKE